MQKVHITSLMASFLAGFCNCSLSPGQVKSLLQQGNGIKLLVSGKLVDLEIGFSCLQVQDKLYYFAVNLISLLINLSTPFGAHSLGHFKRENSICMDCQGAGLCLLLLVLMSLSVRYVRNNFSESSRPGNHFSQLRFFCYW